MLNELSTEGDGSFLFGGKINEQGGRLTVRAYGYVDTQPIPITPGTRDVVVRLTTIKGVGSISGSILIDGHDTETTRRESLGAVRVMAVRPDDFLTGHGWVSYPIQEGPSGFEIRNLEPGPYLIKIGRFGWNEGPFNSASGSVQPPPLVPPVEVNLAPNDELRLEPIDLREILRGFVLTLATPERERVDAEVARISTLGGWQSTTTQRTKGGRLMIIADRKGVDLSITKPPFRTVYLQDVCEDTEVMMCPPLEITLVLAEPVNLPSPELNLYAELLPVEEKGRGKREERRKRIDRMEFVGGRIEFQVEQPGAWRVRWVLGRMENGRLRTQRAMRRSESPEIEILDQLEPQVTRIPPPSPEVIEKLLKRLED